MKARANKQKRGYLMQNWPHTIYTDPWTTFHCLRGVAINSLHLYRLYHLHLFTIQAVESSSDNFSVTRSRKTTRLLTNISYFLFTEISSKRSKNTRPHKKRRSENHRSNSFNPTYLHMHPLTFHAITFTKTESRFKHFQKTVLSAGYHAQMCSPHSAAFFFSFFFWGEGGGSA